MSPQEDPPLTPEEAVARVAQAGAEAAQNAGFACHVELSPGSESTYLHTLREGVWYGIRISCHQAVYDCSQDYEQLRLSNPPSEDDLPGAIESIVQRVLHCGEVVANPADVATAVEKIASVMADGRVYRDADGTRWRWSSDEEAWRQVGRFWGDGEPTPPAHRPNPSVSARIRCQVRHSQNVAARWAADPGGD